MLAKRHDILLSTLFALLLTLAASAVAQPPLTFTTLDYPGSTFTAPEGINDKGQIGGIYADENGVWQGFFFSKGSFTSIQVSGAASTQVRGINNAGDMAGIYFETSGRFHGFLLDHHGVLTTIDVAGAIDTAAISVSDNGQMAGNYYDGNGVWRGFVYSDGQFTTIDVPGSFMPENFFIHMNNAGSIVGTVSDNPTQVPHAFLLSNGSVMTFNFLGSTAFAAARGISSSGDIVGTFIAQARHGFLLSQGRITLIDLPSGASTTPTGINIHGRITGFYTDSNGIQHGYLTQVPAQSSK